MSPEADWRSGAAAYYDLAPHHPDDLDFYIHHLPSPKAAVLELGCGTGRITLPLADHCGAVHGVDSSSAMLARLQEKLAGRSPKLGRVTAECADVSDLDLGRTFDMVIAPFRVMQNLAADDQVSGFLGGLRRHMNPNGVAILNVFNPNRDREAMLETWVRKATPIWEVQDGPDRVVCLDHRKEVAADPLVLYPTLIYRRFRDGEKIDEARLDIAMRCYYPEEFIHLLESAGFQVMERWGGYAGEVYGEGGELVVLFRLGSPP